MRNSAVDKNTNTQLRLDSLPRSGPPPFHVKFMWLPRVKCLDCPAGHVQAVRRRAARLHGKALSSRVPKSLDSHTTSVEERGDGHGGGGGSHEAVPKAHHVKAKIPWEQGQCGYQQGREGDIVSAIAQDAVNPQSQNPFLFIVIVVVILIIIVDSTIAQTASVLQTSASQGARAGRGFTLVGKRAGQESGWEKGQRAFTRWKAAMVRYTENGGRDELVRSVVMTGGLG
ncbi:hypothetical protein IWX48DRAFT_595903 [Phyllosticta citricarpa]